MIKCAVEVSTAHFRLSKRAKPFLTKRLQSAARTPCPPMAANSHTCSLSCICAHAHVAVANVLIFFAACGRQTLRGFFDMLKCAVEVSTAHFLQD